MTQEEMQAKITEQTQEIDELRKRVNDFENYVQKRLYAMERRITQSYSDMKDTTDSIWSAINDIQTYHN